VCEKKICQNTPVINSLLLYSNWCHFCILPPRANLIQSYTMKKKSIILLVRIGEKSTITTTLGCKPLWCSLLCDDKERVCTASISGMARYRKRNPKDRKSFGSSYFGLTRFYGHAHFWKLCGAFLPQFISTETGTILLICFCYYYEFIITITLSIWSDKRCCKKVRWKNKKKSALLYFFSKKNYYILNSPPT